MYVACMYVFIDVACMHSCTGRSSHNISAISAEIRSYLNLEWQRKLDERDSMSVPMAWVKGHPGMSHKYESDTMPSRVADVPCQDNGYDCGLFVLTYMDLWTYSPPDQLQLCVEGTLKGKHLSSAAVMQMPLASSFAM